jgi:hypothetical protein
MDLLTGCRRISLREGPSRGLSIAPCTEKQFGKMDNLAPARGEAHQVTDIERMASPFVTVVLIVLWLWFPPSAGYGHDALHGLMARIIAYRHERLVRWAFALR